MAWKNRKNLSHLGEVHLGSELQSGNKVISSVIQWKMRSIRKVYSKPTDTEKNYFDSGHIMFFLAGDVCLWYRWTAFGKVLRTKLLKLLLQVYVVFGLGRLDNWTCNLQTKQNFLSESCSRAASFLKSVLNDYDINQRSQSNLHSTRNILTARFWSSNYLTP